VDVVLNRFARQGEVLLAAHVNGVLAGIGGITIEPVKPGALRGKLSAFQSLIRLLSS